MNSQTFQENPFGKITSIFNDTTNSYKFYWLLAILNVLQTTDADEIPIEDLCEKMVESVWYPLNYFKLSFGAQDDFKNTADLINLYVDSENSIDPIFKQLKSKADEDTLNKVKSNIKKFARWVPYRFIRPFFQNELKGLPDQSVNKAIIQFANDLSKYNPSLVPYHFAANKIIINKPWKNYLMQNIGLIMGYTLWALVDN